MRRRFLGKEINQRNVGDYVNHLVNSARIHPPTSIFDKPTIILHKIIFVPLSPLVLLQLLTTSILGCIPSILLFPFTLIWLILLYVILATDYLWEKIIIIRPLFIIPGVLISEVANSYVGLLPAFGDWAKRAKNLAICESWPKSRLIYHDRIK